MDSKLVAKLKDELREKHPFFDIVEKYHDGGDGLRSVELLIKLKNDEEVVKLLEALR